MEPATSYMLDVPRDEQERRGKIRTFTGKLVDPLALTPADVCIEDIGHHLSNLCRYTGAVPSFYSVAQHSVIVSQYFSEPVLRMAGLLHDAAEAYINDLASPVKHSVGFATYREADERITALIFRAFGVPEAMIREVKPLDDLAFKREVASFWDVGALNGAHTRIVPVAPPMAKMLFMNEYRMIKSRMAATRAAEVSNVV